LNSGKHNRNFWLGNAILAVAMLTLIFMGQLSNVLGIWAPVIWMVLAAVGVTVLMSGKSDEPPEPD